MALKYLLAACLALAGALFASADERINRFDTTITVQTDGDIEVTERITVTAEGDRIRRGIFRDLPRYFEGPDGRQRYDYDVRRVTRNGDREPYTVEAEGNATRIRIGDGDVFLPEGRHTYEIGYEVTNQVRYFEGYDEIYWNVTGSYWEFPIEVARATVELPAGAQTLQTAGYTGAQGDDGQAYSYTRNGDAHVFTTTRPLGPREGLTVAVGFEKGVIDPPSVGDAAALWWQRNGSAAILFASVIALIGWLWRSFNRVGRDPPRGPVFPRYEPPEGLSPAGVHHVYYRRVAGHRALIATLIHLATRGRIEIEPEDKTTTRLIRKGGETDGLSPEEIELENALFSNRTELTLGKSPDKAFTRDYRDFQKALAKRFGRPYFRWNAGYTAITLIASGVAVIVALSGLVSWNIWMTLGLVALAGVNIAFMYFIPAPTALGQRVRTEIEGFRIYLETAEKLQLNAAEVGGEAPPPMSVERYERFLPYAVALDVEEPWTRHFERLIPREAASYHPGWAHMSGHGSVSSLNSSLVSGLSSGVATAMPSSSGSSGSGGGGFSGGGGGGGGGGGW
ncbi:MAG: DUF2207 domain-containing protein [Alphaproteobacteria bacterium]|jgi:uncharacterized membrane protein YgcG|nr:DUF2207 domain-containing protein [Alphaproteobacteria bacterium]